MSTLANRAIEQVQVIDVRVTDCTLHVILSDGRELTLLLTDVPWLEWLAAAAPQQQANWSIEPGGTAIYWEDLDDGVELCHLLAMQPLAGSRASTTKTRRKIRRLAPITDER